jgi:RNA polymerase sigma-70 factor (ECF subfamily)
MDQLSDCELAQLFNEQPTAYFESVYARYSDPLSRFIYRFTGNQEAAEEILHDVFLELHSGKFQSGDGKNLKAWLFTVAKNKGLNSIQRIAKFSSSSAQLDELASSENIESNLFEKSILQHLAVAEISLPTDLSETWQLRKQGYDYQQIAERLKIPLGTVKSRFSRLVQYLREQKEFRNGL